MADETRLVAVFDADLRGFVKGMEQGKVFSDKFFGDLQAKMQATERGISSSFGGLGNDLKKFLSVAALEEFTRHILTMTAGLVDTATVAHVSTDALQAFREVMKDAGGSAEDADNLLKKLNVTIGAAKLGVGQATDAFAHLGLGPQDLVGTTEQVLQRVAKALLNIKDEQVRGRLETELFSRSGQEFERVLVAVAGGLGAVTEKLREQNRIIGADTALEAKESLLQLADAWNQVEVAAAGPIAFMLKGFADLISDAKELINLLPTDAQLLAKVGIGGAATASFPASVDVTPRISGTGTPFKTQKELADEKKAADDALRALKAANEKFSAFTDALIAKNRVQFHESISTAGQVIRQAKDDFASAQDELSVVEHEANVNKLRGTEEAFNAQRTLLLDQTNAQIADIQRRKNADLTALSDQKLGEANYQDARESIEAAANARIAIARAQFSIDLTNIEESQTQRLRQTIQATDELRSAFTDVGVAATHGFTSFKDAAAQALRRILDMTTQLLIMKPLVDSLFGQQGTTGSGILGSLIGSSGSIANGNIGTGLIGLLGFAGGGSPPVGVPSVVGERGPELFVPRVPGTIIPNGGIGGTSIAISVDARGAQMGVAEQLRAVLPTVIAQAVKQSDSRFARNFDLTLRDKR